METDIGKTFLKLVKNHFPCNKSFHMIFNNNTIKTINSIIASYSKSILHLKSKEHGCNCRNKESCPLLNQCLTPKVIYKATVVNNSDDEKQVYFGASDTPFKEKYCNHTRDFNHKHYSKWIQLSKYIWQLKINLKNPSREWQIVRKVICDAKSKYC